MKEPVFTGTCTAIVTPFQPSGVIDYVRFSALIEAQVEAGVDAICVCGTTGESATLSLREHLDVVRHCIRQVGGRCKIIAGSGSNDTATALYLSQQAEDAGADALLLVTPYYNKTTQSGLIQHYESIAEQVDSPLILYNVPSRTGLSFTAETYHILSQHPRINGTKEASGNFSLIVETRALCGDDLHVWSGNDDHTVAMMALGASGLVSVASNLIPEAMVSMTHAMLAGHTDAALALQLRYAGLIHALFSEVNPIPIKTALEMLDLDSGRVRLPLCPIGDAARAALRGEMKKLGILNES